MTIHQSNENGKITLSPEGWLDTVSSPELSNAVDSLTEASGLVLDFSMVEYMASAGLRAVVAAGKKAKSMNAEFSVINVVPGVMSIFRMTGIDKKLNIIEK
ncbi:MAG: STAS domain-containing protein [Clostridia bacterium]|nr:STAS domain-containing protein [Clostridia bacterium]